MEAPLAANISEYAFQRDQVEFALGDTLDIKTGLILAALTFLAIQSGDLIKPGLPIYQNFMEAISVLCLVLSGSFCVYELLPRDYDRDRTPEEYIDWIERKKAAGHEDSEMPSIVADMRLKLANQRIANNFAINAKKSKAMNTAFVFMVIAFGLNILTLLTRLF